MTDIVDRLRAYMVAAHDGPALHPSICDEAADEIERLREFMGAIPDIVRTAEAKSFREIKQEIKNGPSV